MSEPKGHGAPKANGRSVKGQMPHPGTEVLAEFRAGLVTGRRGTRIAAHLSGCERCADLDGQLAEVSVLLAAVPAPAMPESVARRLDTVLAAEVAARTDGAERAGLHGSRRAEGHGRRARNGGFRLLALRVMAPVAAAGVLAAGGYGLSQITQGTTSQASSASAGHAAKSVGGANAAVEPTAGAAASPKTRIMTPVSIPVVISQANYTRATLKHDLEAALHGSTAPAATRDATAQERACILHLTDGAPLVKVEHARYEGQPATVIVARTGQGEMVWVAGQNCSATNRDVLDTATLLPGISGP